MQLSVLTIKKEIEGVMVVLFPVLIQVGGRNYLVDCGYEETAQELEFELKARDVGINDLEGVIVTHDDYDHLGGLGFLKQRNPGIKVFKRVNAPGFKKAARLTPKDLALIFEEFGPPKAIREPFTMDVVKEMG